MECKQNAGLDFGTNQKVADGKKAARALARSLLKTLSAADREAFSRKAALSFLKSSIYKDAECVAAFFSLPDEIDTLPIIARAFLDKKRVLLPRVVPGSNKMDFYELTPAILPIRVIMARKLFTCALASAVIPAPVLGVESLASALDAQTEKNAWGIREPLLSLPLIAKEKFPARAAILVPGLAFAKDGRRLGRGKGFYDRYLSELRAENPAFLREGKACGYCFGFQIAGDVPTEENDVLMDAVFC